TPAYGLALTLGGGEVRLLDLTAAYGAFANGGMRVTPFAIRRVETLDGEVVFDATEAAPAQARVLDPRVAFLITDILSDEVARRPAFGAGSALEIGRPAAVKTGTTTDWRDNWTVGYTPDLVVGVWVGNADNTPMHGVSGVTGAAPIWHDFMRSVLRNTAPRAFPRPDGLIQLEVCAEGGLRPEDDFGRQASDVKRQGAVAATCPYKRYEWFIVGTEPAEEKRSGDLTGQLSYVTPVAPETTLTSPRSTVSGRRSVFSEKEVGKPDIALTSPDPNRAYRIDPGLPAEVQKLPISARVSEELRAGNAAVMLLVDGAPWTTVAGPDYTAWWDLRPGAHTFEALVIGADGAHMRSAPINIFVEH
ncbi:MAG: penicillin-binding transpeptidase domain-containing protein, partial [Anaerolineae bacterium]